MKPPRPKRARRRARAEPVPEPTPPGLGPVDVALAAAYALPVTGLGLVLLLASGTGLLKDLVNLISATSPFAATPLRAFVSLLLALLLGSFLCNCALLGRSPPAHELRGRHRFGVPAAGALSGFFVFPGLLLLVAF